MKNKYVFVVILLLVLSLLGVGFTRVYTGVDKEEQKEEFLIVTSFYPMYVATLNVADGIDGVTVKNLSEPQTGCLHDYQLTPQDMILLSKADAFVVNGGGIESFLSEVAEAYPHLTIIHGTEGQFEQEEHKHQRDHGHDHEHGENAHVWMSIPHYMEQVRIICQKLQEADVSHAAAYGENGDKYLAKIEVLHQEAEVLAEKMQDTPIVIFHEAFAYLAEDYGMEIAGELNLDDNHQVSAGEVAEIVAAIKSLRIEILLAEDLYGKELGATIESETNCKVYYLNTLVRSENENDFDAKNSWLVGMEQNIQILKGALEGE